MKRYRIYLIGLLALMVSCVGDDHSQQRAQQQSLGADDSQGVPITFTYTALQVDTAATRSAASATLSDAVIEANQAVTVRVRQHDQSQFSSYTFTSASGGVLTPPEEAPTYPINGTAVDIRAFTPSSAATGTFTVQQHQDTDAGYIASDLMWTKVDNQTSSASPVPLTFVHKMAKVRVTAHAGVAISSINRIRLLNVKPTVTFDYDGASGTLGAATGSTEVFLFTEGTGNTATGVACIPPQTFTDADLLAVDVTLADGTSTGTVLYRVDSKQFVGSKLYSLDVTVSRPQVGATITISGWTDSNSVNTTTSGGDFSIADIPAQTYTGSALTPAVTVSYNSTALTASDYDVYYYSNTDAGTAYVGVLGKGNYAGVHDIKAFTINKANSTYTAPTAKNLTYTGSPLELVTAGSTSHGTMQYKLDDGSWGTSIPTATAVGSYTVYYKVVGDANHNDNSGSSVAVTISKASSTYTAPTAKTNLTYTGSPLALVNAGSTSHGTMQYKLGSGSWGTSIPTATAAGSYTVYYQVVGDDNHSDNSGGSVAVTIAKAASTYTAPTAKNRTYHGSSTALVTAGSTSHGTMQYKLGSGSWGTSIPTATNAGSYTVYYRVVGDANHNDNSGSSVAVTIAKATGYVTLSANSGSVTYNSTSTFTVSSNHGGTLSVTPTSNSNSYVNATISGTTVTLTGRSATTNFQTVTVSCAATTNYKAASATYSATVSKASSSMSSISAVSFTSSQNVNSQISRTVSCTNCSVSSYTTSGSGFSVSRSGNTITVTRTSADAFSGTVTVTGTGNTNYNNPSSRSFSVSGEKCPPNANGHAYVDLGNPSCYYATMNIGASSEGAYGSSFAWGETTTKSSYTSDNYTASSISSNLTTSQDAARVNWGGDWRMATKDELLWLIKNCTWTWTTADGNEGFRVTSEISGYTSNSIFLPASGYRYSVGISGRGWMAYYWSSTYYDSSKAYILKIIEENSTRGTDYVQRYYGLTVRAVLSK